MGTINNPPEDYVTQFSNILNSMNVQWLFQHEVGSNTHTAHVHIGIYFPNAVGIEFQSKFDNAFHWQYDKSWRYTKDYCSKVRTRTNGPWTNISNLRYRKTIIDPLNGKVLYKWQRNMIATLKRTPDDRKIYWLWEPIGNTGKSSLAKHICMNYNCCVLNGSSKDCFYALRVMNEKTDIDVVIFDLSRNQRNRVSYNAIEGCKNGMFFSGKYESGYTLMNTPHVFVFANFAPDTDGLSEDRWIIRRI